MASSAEGVRHVKEKLTLLREAIGALRDVGGSSEGEIEALESLVDSLEVYLTRSEGG